MHRCQIMPGRGVGRHFHNQCEEMFIIFEGQAEFTIDGRTSTLRGTVGAPTRMGHSHAIYNPSAQAVEFMNINVTAVKNKYDAFNLATHASGFRKTKSVFMTMRLNRKLLRLMPAYHGGAGTAQYRRALGPEVFLTNWSYVDHLLLPRGASEGRRRHAGLEEIYYVLNGDSEVQVENETAPIHKGDAVPVLPNQVHSIRNDATQDLELMIVGIANHKGMLDTVEVK